MVFSMLNSKGAMAWFSENVGIRNLPKENHTDYPLRKFNVSIVERVHASRGDGFANGFYGCGQSFLLDDLTNENFPRESPNRTRSPLNRCNESWCSAPVINHDSPRRTELSSNWPFPLSRSRAVIFANPIQPTAYDVSALMVPSGFFLTLGKDSKFVGCAPKGESEKAYNNCGNGSDCALMSLKKVSDCHDPTKRVAQGNGLISGLIFFGGLIVIALTGIYLFLRK